MAASWKFALFWDICNFENQDVLLFRTNALRLFIHFGKIPLYMFPKIVTQDVGALIQITQLFRANRCYHNWQPIHQDLALRVTIDPIG